MADDALFDTPQADQHPDAVIAREEIRRYYDDRLAEAEQAVAEAIQRRDARQRERIAWIAHGQITHDGMDGKFLCEASMIASRSLSRWQRAATDAIFKGGDRAAAERLGEREKALRRWLTANGYDLGALAEPPPQEKRKRRPDRG